jgi:hypothetical protein
MRYAKKDMQKHKPRPNPQGMQKIHMQKMRYAKRWGMQMSKKSEKWGMQKKLCRKIRDAKKPDKWGMQKKGCKEKGYKVNYKK